jgi:hydroxymethylbilane synthase
VSAARLVVGTRGSPLALVQAGEVAAHLRAARPDVEVAIETIATLGDRVLDVPLARVGGKGLFTKELEAALLDGRVDLAVHSAKDLPTTLPAGLSVAAFTRREDPRDVFVAAGAGPRPAAPAALAAGARVGSSSLRRRAQLHALRPDLRLVDLRGNVETRLRKLAEQGLDGTVLAAAGLARLGRSALAAFTFSAAELLPAVGQGALAVEVRAGDERVAALVAGLDDRRTALAVRAERALLAALDGGCQAPIAAYAELVGPPAEGEHLRLSAFVGSLDGARALRGALTAPAAAPEALGEALAERLRAAGADRLLAEVRAADLAPGSAR